MAHGEASILSERSFTNGEPIVVNESEFKVQIQRICNHCRLPKDIEEFGRDTTRKGGRRYMCKKCASATQQIRVQKQRWMNRK